MKKNEKHRSERIKKFSTKIETNQITIMTFEIVTIRFIIKKTIEIFFINARNIEINIIHNNIY